MNKQTDNYNLFAIKTGDRFTSNYLNGILLIADVENGKAKIIFLDAREAYRNGEQWKISDIEKEIASGELQSLISRQFRRKSPDGSFTRGYGIWEDMADRNEWNFICQFLPNYERRDDVMISDDLACVIDKEKSLEWLYKNYPEWDDLSIGELEKIRAQWDYELFQEAGGYLTDAIQSGEIEVREFPVTIVSARIERDNDSDCVILQCADIRSHGFGEEFSVPSRQLQHVMSRELPDYNPKVNDDWQIQVFYESKTSGESYWCNAVNIDFE